MPSKRIETPQDALTYRIIGCAMALHRARGPGYREDTYQRDLEVHFARQEVSFEPQKMVPVYDSTPAGVLVGYYIPDFVVAGQVIVEIKALNALDDVHVAQVISYLAVTGCDVGLLINFGARSLQVRRVLPPSKVIDHRLNHRWLFVPDSLKQKEPGAD